MDFRLGLGGRAFTSAPQDSSRTSDLQHIASRNADFFTEKPAV